MKDQIKSYLQRLNHGEALENVQADFVRECKDVDPAEIMHAEQELLREGTSIEELQRLCDVHSALFHGSTTEEKIANAEKMLSQYYYAQGDSLQAAKLHNSSKGYYDSIGINRRLDRQEVEIVEIIESHQQEELEETIGKILANQNLKQYSFA